MTPIYAIGDVHGQFELLVDAIERIDRDGGPDARIVVLGDLVDRGPDSFACVELLRIGVEEGRDWTVLRGNHDQMFHDFVTRGRVDHPRIVSKVDWMHGRLGGLETLKSYGVNVEASLSEMALEARDKVPQSHIDFIANLPLVYETRLHLFVHAGIRPDVALEEQEFDDLLWIREPFLSYEDPFDWLVVHGHTALDAPMHYGNRINLDGGAGYGRPLSVAVFEGEDVSLLTASGREAL